MARNVTIVFGAVVSQGKVLTILHASRGSWELPGGHVEESDNTLVEALARELHEETGVRLEHGYKPPLIATFPSMPPSRLMVERGTDPADRYTFHLYAVEKWVSAPPLECPSFDCSSDEVEAVVWEDIQRYHEGDPIRGGNPVGELHSALMYTLKYWVNARVTA